MWGTGGAVAALSDMTKIGQVITTLVEQFEYIFKFVGASVSSSGYGDTNVLFLLYFVGLYKSVCTGYSERSRARLFLLSSYHCDIVNG